MAIGTHIKRLGKDTAIYGISTIIGRFLTFLLVPFYTNVLHPTEYGIVTYIYSLLAFAGIMYAYGMESAYFKYISSSEKNNSRKVFTTSFCSLAISSIIFSCCIIIFGKSFATLISLSTEYTTLLYYSVGMLICDTIVIIPFASLRYERKAKQFAALKVFNIIINVLLNIYLLVFLKMGVEGIFISGFISSFLGLIIVLPFIVNNLQFTIETQLLKNLLKFAIPTIPSGLASIAIQIIDRPILRALTDDTTVGIYQANYKLGIFMMLIVSMYDYAWKPFYFSISKEPNAKEIFARVLTYLVFCMCIVFLFLSFFIHDVVTFNFFGRHLIHPKYWSGLGIVPIILSGYIFLGIATNLSAGLYIQKKTELTSIYTFVGAIVNIVANYLLIPQYGIYGAAWATFIAYIAMAITLYYISRKVYPVHYETYRLLKIIFTTGIIYGLFEVLNFYKQQHILIGASLLVGWIILLWGIKFFDKGELHNIQRLMRIRD